jgi:pimeloyl-ACP methyl ester carboxylesterase
MVTHNVTRMDTADVNGVNLEYVVRGGGEAVLLIHGSIMGDAFSPLLAEQALIDRYRVISYHRRGYNGSSRALPPFTIRDQAADARALLDRLGIERAHVVGHSYGGLIALQLALDAPQRVHSMALLEPGTLWSAYPDIAEQFIEPIRQLYEAGDPTGAISTFCQAVAGASFAEKVERALGKDWLSRALELAVVDIDTLFQVELPAMMDWRFTQEHAARITQPVLSVLGGDSAEVDPSAAEEHALLQAWMPQTEAFVLAGATHALQLMNPAGMAEGLAFFLSRHPMAVSA